jgi:O-antigen ligase
LRALIRKIDIINVLFVLGFPCFGVGAWLSFTREFSVGLIFSALPHGLILAFFLLDTLYKGVLKPVVNANYGLTMLFLLSLCWTMWYALLKGFPGLNPINVTAYCILFVVPYNAAVLVQIYNRDNEDFDLARMLLLSMGLVMLVNVGGSAMGFYNKIHSFEGRINLPFLRSIYDGAHLLSMVCLMLLFYIKDFSERPLRWIMLAGAFGVSLALMVLINSRLSLMVFMVFLLLFVTRSMRSARGIYGISLFTMPILVSFSLLVYQVLSLPFFTALLDRVSKEDVTTFNGRTYIWNAVGEWFLDDRRGLLLGNGYHGHYQVGMLDFMRKLWEGSTFNIHLHSTFLEILVSQGVLALVLFYVLMYRCFAHFRELYLEDRLEAPLFAAFVYMLFIYQIDIFCYADNIGSPVLFAMLSAIALRQGVVERRPRSLGALKEPAV